MHIKYDNTTGRLLSILTFPAIRLADFEAVLPENHSLFSWVGRIDLNMYYHDLVNTLRLRPVITSEPDKTEIQADDEEIITLTGLPIPCTITIDNHVTEMTDPEDDTFEWSTLMPGTYEIKIEAWPYQEWSREVTAI